MSNCSSLLLGLTDIDVDLVGVGADGTRDVRVLTAQAWVGRCPQCSVVSTRSKGWVVTRPASARRAAMSQPAANCGRSEGATRFAT